MSHTKRSHTRCFFKGTEKMHDVWYFGFRRTPIDFLFFVNKCTLLLNVNYILLICNNYYNYYIFFKQTQANPLFDSCISMAAVILSWGAVCFWRHCIQCVDVIPELFLKHLSWNPIPILITNYFRLISFSQKNKFFFADVHFLWCLQATVMQQKQEFRKKLITDGVTQQNLKNILPIVQRGTSILSRLLRSTAVPKSH